jgi:hypothetical protein
MHVHDDDWRVPLQAPLRERIADGWTVLTEAAPERAIYLWRPRHSSSGRIRGLWRGAGQPRTETLRLWMDEDGNVRAELVL